MMNEDHTAIDELGRRWAAAEERGDVDTLDAIATDDFRLVGPFGFVLDKQQWLDRYRSGDLVTEHLEWTDTDVRLHGDVAITIGVQSQAARYRGERSDGRFRVTQIGARGIDGWQLAGLQLSPLGLVPPAGAPAGTVTEGSR
jgi:ketosteroid isomerase-like protein